LEQLGAEILRRKYAFKRAAGFSLDDVRLPERIFETEAPAGPFDEAFMREALSHYQALLEDEDV
jgi:aldehyde:ferredoxin oxidoreductase